MTPERKLLAMLLAPLIALLFFACGGGDATGPAVTETALSVDVGPVTTLDEYLVIALQLQVEVGRDSSARLAALPDPQEEPEAAATRGAELLSALGNLYGESADTLDGVTPPPEARAFHNDLLGVFRRLEDGLERLAAADDLDTFNSIFSDEVLVGLLELTEIGAEGERLAIDALASRSADPLSEYLVSAMEIRADYTTEFAGFGTELQAALSAVQTEEDLEGIVGLIDEVRPTLEESAERLDALTPPESAADIHRRQIELQTEALALLGGITDAMRNQDVDTLADRFSEYQDFGIRSTELSTEWTELLIVALTR